MPRKPATPTSPRPTMPPIDFAAIPDQLKVHDTWVNWFYGWDYRRESWTKKPICPDARKGKFAEADNPDTWDTYIAAATACLLTDDNWMGLGFEITPSSGVVVIDLDKCRDPETGELTPFAAEWVQRFNTYTEVSVSGKGLHLFLQAEKKDPRCRRGGVEVYGKERFITVNGDRLEGTPEAIEQRQDVLDAFYATVWPEPLAVPRANTDAGNLPPAGSLSLTDQDIIDRATASKNGDKFTRLWNGDTSDYRGDRSSADAGLASMLAFWCGPDPARIASLMRQSHLNRSKWDRKDYLPTTIQRAIDRCKTFFGERDSNWKSDLDKELEAIEGLTVPQMLCAGGGKRPQGGDGAESKPADLDLKPKPKFNLDDLSPTTMRSVFEKAAAERRLSEAEAASHLKWLDKGCEDLHCCWSPQQFHQDHLYKANLSRLVRTRCRHCLQCERWLREQHKANLTWRIQAEPDGVQFWKINLPAGVAWTKRVYDAYARDFQGHYAAVKLPEGGYIVIGCTPAGVAWHGAPTAIPVERSAALPLALQSIESAPLGGKFIHTGKAWRLPQPPKIENKQWSEGRALPPQLAHETVVEICEANGVEIEHRAVPSGLRHRFLKQFYFRCPGWWNAERREHFYFQLQQQEVIPFDVQIDRGAGEPDGDEGEAVNAANAAPGDTSGFDISP